MRLQLTKKPVLQEKHFANSIGWCQATSSLSEATIQNLESTQKMVLGAFQTNLKLTTKLATNLNNQSQYLPWTCTTK